MILCSKHGASPLSLVTLALGQRIALSLSIPKDEYIRLDYEYLAQVADRYYLDLDTAARHGLSKSERLSLPDEYPAFVAEVVPVCFKCLDALLQK